MGIGLGRAVMINNRRPFALVELQVPDTVHQEVQAELLPEFRAL